VAVRNSSDIIRRLPEKRRVLVITHDVDWPRKGPGISHVLARRERFSADVIRRVTDEGFNPYYGVPIVAEIEERLNIRSTFFFRPIYDDGSTVDEYKDTIKDLVRNGWEIGLHVNDPSTVEQIKSERKLLEEIVASPVYGSRIHYLRVSENSFSNLAQAGFKYDSSLVYSKNTIDPRNSNCLVKNGLLVFPITFMDTYLFALLGLTEETVTEFVLNTMERLFASDVRIITLLWHDNSIMMKGGRAYTDLISRVASDSSIHLLRGIEAYELVQNLTRAQ
jgi:peptidoglycan/xylan/chitin deacetylase (PgdA/CDA1 family)